jgi:hypothetical protein
MTQDEALELARFLKWTIARNGVVEARVFVGTTAYSGYFDNVSSFLRVIAANSTQPPRTTLKWAEVPHDGEAEAFYWTLNACLPGLLARNANVLVRAKRTTEDSEIIRIRHVLVDLDAQRPVGISSSISEKLAATTVAQHVFEYLQSKGITGIAASSGNGSHILIPVDYPVEGTPWQISKFLNFLSDKFSTKEVKVDTSVYNPSRVSKIYGTMVCKGSSIPDRPHRRSAVGLLTDVGVNFDVLDAFKSEIDSYAPPSKVPVSITTSEDPISKRDAHIEILREVLTKGGHIFREKDKDKTSDTGERRPVHVFEFENCPIHCALPEGDPDGKDSDSYECSVMVEADGQFCGHCFHNPQKYHWAEFKAVIEFDKHKPPSSLIPDNIDLNAFFQNSTEAAATTSTTSESTYVDSRVSLADSKPEVYVEPNLHTEYLIPHVDGGLFMRGSVCPIAAQPQTGKTVVILQGIIRPLLEGLPVIGRLQPVEKKLRIWYIQTDYSRDNFYDRFLRKFGWSSPYVTELKFIHTKNLKQFSIVDFCQFLRQYSKDYDLIIIDTVTTLFPNLVWGKSAQSDSMFLLRFLSDLAIEYKNCFVPTLHTRKKLDSGSLTIPQEIDPDSVLGPALKPCEAAIGLWPCYYRIGYPTGKFNKNGTEVVIDRYHPIYGMGCMKSLKNVSLLDGYENISQYKIHNDKKPIEMEWLPYENFIIPADASVLENMKNAERMDLFFPEDIPEKYRTIGAIAQLTGISLSGVYKTIKKGYKNGRYALEGGKLEDRNVLLQQGGIGPIPMDIKD